MAADTGSSAEVDTGELARDTDSVGEEHMGWTSAALRAQVGQAGSVSVSK